MDLSTEPHAPFSKTLIYPPQGIPRDLMVGFLARGHDSVGNLRASLERGEFEVIRVFGHRLKGTGGGYGLPPLTEIGTAIERAAVGQNSGELRNLLGAEGHTHSLHFLHLCLAGGGSRP